ncbi:uncharacterized protein LOC143364275 [Halictus rubicundus]|uniref:uncharacterized protein LOC143364275 n=1 Tax=Halictus rubicundus TaxID=77578 RepID=UPI0040366F04
MNKTEPRTFFMGQDRYTTDRYVKIRIFDQSHKFFVIPDDFPLIEDGIIGLPCLEKYQYEISNDKIKLNDNVLYFQKPATVQPGEVKVQTIYLEGRPTRVCFFNFGETNKDISNQIYNINDIDQIGKFKAIVRTSHIEKNLREPIEKILIHYLDVFNLETDTLPCTNLAKHTITLKENKIINTKSYRPPECHKLEIEKQMNDMLNKKIIEESDSPYNSPVWVVPKKADASGKQKWRIVIDFRKLNELTDQDAYPLPDIDDILSQLGNAKFFSALDLSSGFHQIPMDPDSKKYTAFSTPQGHFHYNRMPFGLKNAPATFQRMMDTALRGLVNKHCFVYLDDIIIFGDTIGKHNENLAMVLQRLRELGLKIQPDKCEFLKPELEYLGHLVTAEGVKPNPKKILAVERFKVPTTPTEIKSFLGLSGYYRKFIRNFSKIAKPLTDLTQKDVPFHWTDKQQNSFETLKQKLCEAPVLTYPDFNRQFTLTTDASNEGIGAVLSQDGHPCCYISRTLNAPERNYTTTEKELLAIVWAVKRLRQYLLGRKFVIRTDHQALKWLNNCKDPSSRLMRWRLKLEEYEYEIEYTKGKDDTAADALSRVHAITRQQDEEDPEIQNHLKIFDEWEKDETIPARLKIVPNDHTFYQLTKTELGNYDRINWLKKIYQILQKSTKIGIGDKALTEMEKNRIKIILMYFNDRYKTIYFAWEPIRELTEEEIETILKENHNDATGHFGIQKTYQRIKDKFKIPHLMEKIEDYVKRCDACQKEKLTRIRPKEMPIISDTPMQPNDKIAMDIIGPMTKTKKGNQFILSIHDDLTKYLILVPLKTQQTESILNALLDHYIYIFSAPKTILTDQGQNFVSELMTKFEEAFKIKHVKTTSFHPQSNGSLERTHATVKDLIRTSLHDSDKEWDDVLNFICLGYNTSIHEATGFTPFELTFGRKANLPSSIARTTGFTYDEMFSLWQKQLNRYLTLARETLLKSKKRYQRDQRRKIVRTQAIFKEGDFVLVHNDHKKDKLDVEWAVTITFTGNLVYGLDIVPLEDSSIFHEEINKAYLYNSEVDIYIGLNIDDVFIRFNQVKMYTKGSVSKSLFGTLDNNDLELINANIDKLFNEGNELKTIVSNQTALIRKIISSDGIKRIENLSLAFKDLEQATNREELITELFIRTESAIYDLQFQLDETLNVILMAKQGIISPQIIDHEIFINNFGKALAHKALNSAIEPKKENFQFILDIAALKSVLREQQEILRTLPVFRSLQAIYLEGIFKIAKEDCKVASDVSATFASPRDNITIGCTEVQHQQSSERIHRIQSRKQQQRQHSKEDITCGSNHIRQTRNENIDNPECNRSESTTINQLRTRITKIQEDFKTFDSIQEALELLAGPEIFKTRLEERAQFEHNYFEVIAEAQTIVDNATKQFEKSVARSTGSPVDDDEQSDNETNVKLPTLHLPKFSGSYETWPGFCDTFKSAVHENPRFRDAQKLMYLRSCLTGKAAEKVESLETTAANYKVAWDILEKSYNNPTAIVNSRVKSFFELPLVNRAQPNSLRELLDKANKHYRALEALDKPFLEAFPIYAITSKLDEQTRLKWKERTQGKTSPTVNELLEFLHNRCQLLEETQPETGRKPYQSVQRAPHNPYNHSKSSLAYPSSVAFNCICNICKGSHYTQYCPKLVSMNVDQRIELIRKSGLCHNCLRSNHATKNCKATACKKCKGKHHTMIHIDNQESNQLSLSPTTTLSTINSPSEVLLSTALIHIADENGTLHTCRILLDSGSQSHFLTDNIVTKLGLRRDAINIPVTGINQITSTINTSVSTTIQSRMSLFSAKLNFLVVPRISGSIPNQAIRAAELKIPANIRLADPNFHKPSRIDGLIGAELFYKLLAIGQIALSNTSVILQKTKLGWVVSGNLPTSNKSNPQVCNLALESLHEQIAKFWEVENGPQRLLRSEEESECEKRYIETTTRNKETGRYTVGLPFKTGTMNLGNSYNVALKRFYSLERSLSRNPQLKSLYTEFLREYEELGHMTVAQVCAPDDGYYLPHHGVIKGNSLTTKLRVVFDASCKTSTDIAKMYRQIEIDPDDCKYQKILWRETSDQPIKTYRLKTVTYGTSCAPFLAIRTLHQLAKDEAANHPLAADILRTDFYVDDLLTGAKTYEDAIKIREEITTLCYKGGFQLRQWASNVPELIDGQQDKCEDAHLNLDLDNTINALGLLAPIIIRAKMLMQELWAIKLDWDESVPVEIYTRWINYCQDLTHVKRVNIARKVVIADELNKAVLRIIKLTQQEGFSKEIHNIIKQNDSSSSLSPLTPFIDKDGLLRVGGRLAHSKLTYSEKHPLLLPKGHHVTNLIIKHHHLQNFHSGTQTTLHSIRQKYWIPGGRNAVKHNIYACVTCRRAKPITLDYLMGDLPKGRVNYTRPFLHSGVDFCGPVFIKEKTKRNRGKEKVYLAIFVCFATKAVHIEIVTDLTTEACLAALRRFFARRGKSAHIYSDNATNFVGSKRELHELYAFVRSQSTNSNIANTLANENIQWHVIPPRSPHFGGLWEAAVKSLKFHMTRVIGETLLSYEALLTYVNQIEAILNSRPLTPLSSDPNDLSVLTPAHFLIGDTLTSVPDYNWTEVPSGRLSSWQHVQKMRQHFWRRWSKEYLHELTTRKKWHARKPEQVDIGSIVIVRDDNLPAMRWTLARIIQLHPGEDNIVRVVTIRTANGEYKRSLKCLAPLPI